MIDRRKFLQTSGVAAAGLATNPRARALDAQEPKTDKEARLFVDCCAMSYSKYLRSGQMAMEDFIRKGIELQFAEPPCQRRLAIGHSSQPVCHDEPTAVAGGLVAAIGGGCFSDRTA